MGACSTVLPLTISFGWRGSWRIGMDVEAEGRSKHNFKFVILERSAKHAVEGPRRSSPNSSPPNHFRSRQRASQIRRLEIDARWSPGRTFSGSFDYGLWPSLRMTILCRNRTNYMQNLGLSATLRGICAWRKVGLSATLRGICAWPNAGVLRSVVTTARPRA